MGLDIYPCRDIPISKDLASVITGQPAEGYEVKCILTGLGELKPIQELFVEHAQRALAEG